LATTRIKAVEAFEVDYRAEWPEAVAAEPD